MNERMHQLRKELKLTQEAFGEKLGISKSAVSNMESGRYNITDTMLKLTCQKLNVNEHWLRTGEGEMFNDQPISLDEFARQNDLDDFDYKIIRHYISLDSAQRKIIQSFFSLQE